MQLINWPPLQLSGFLYYNYHRGKQLKILGDEAYLLTLFYTKQFHCAVYLPDESLMRDEYLCEYLLKKEAGYLWLSPVPTSWAMQHFQKPFGHQHYKCAVLQLKFFLSLQK